MRGEGVGPEERADQESDVGEDERELVAVDVAEVAQRSRYNESSEGEHGHEVAHVHYRAVQSLAERPHDGEEHSSRGIAHKGHPRHDEHRGVSEYLQSEASFLK